MYPANNGSYAHIESLNCDKVTATAKELTQHRAPNTIILNPQVLMWNSMNAREARLSSVPRGGIELALASNNATITAKTVALTTLKEMVGQRPALRHEIANTLYVLEELSEESKSIKQALDRHAGIRDSVKKGVAVFDHERLSRRWKPRIRNSRPSEFNRFRRSASLSIIGDATTGETRPERGARRPRGSGLQQD